MRVYAYRCPAHGVFEREGGLDDSTTACDCGQLARRMPYSGVPNLKGETVSKGIPDPVYRQEAEKRELNRTWGDASRSMELLRAHRYEGADGQMRIDTAAVMRES